MADDEELTEEQQLRIAAKLLGSEASRITHVEVRRSRKPSSKPEPVEIRFIHMHDHYDDAWVWCEVEQKASSGWVKQETFEDRGAANRAAQAYSRGGDIVTHFKKTV